MTVPEAMFAYVGAFVDELVRSGVNQVVISPGSRSTPLAMLMMEHEQMQTWVHVDERSAAFFALGIAKASQHPVAIVCTSGTAAANYMPAIVESFHGRIPLLVLTADRPHELRDNGAPQAIRQINLYGEYAKWFIEMPLPENTSHMLRHVRTVAGRAAAVARSGPSGPVHLNFPFREPLVPLIPSPTIWAGGRTGQQEYVSVAQGRRYLSQERMDTLATDLKGLERGLIVCGPQDDATFVEHVTRLGQALHYPILADPLSQLRNGSYDQSGIIDRYDAFLRDEQMMHTYKPDVIIRFGAMPVSKSFLLYLQQHSDCRQLVVDAHGDWLESTSTASDMLHTDPLTFCQSLCARINQDQDKDKLPTFWYRSWQEINQLTREILTERAYSLGQDVFVDELFEGSVFVELETLLPKKTTLFVGNSMPVRDLDTFFGGYGSQVRIMGNRGASGIDGVISSAFGASTQQEEPLVLVIGDLSFYHDLNGLLAAKLFDLNVTIILINNDGGGIFSFLPQAKNERHFESLFGTPLGLDYRPTVEMYGGSFTSIQTWDDFRDKVKRSLNQPGLKVIEVRTNRQTNVAMHRYIFKCLSDTLPGKIAT